MAREPGRAYVKKYLHPKTGEHIGYQSSTKWGKVKWWRKADSALEKAKQHAGVDKLDEEAPVNAVGGGHIAGVGIGPQGEPPAKAKMTKRPMKRFKDYIKRTT